MSLGKEPAGALNKAQRLIEFTQHIRLSQVLQGALLLNLITESSNRPERKMQDLGLRPPQTLLRQASSPAFRHDSQHSADGPLARHRSKPKLQLPSRKVVGPHLNYLYSKVLHKRQ
jgi:hypothetical protein